MPKNQKRVLVFIAVLTFACVIGVYLHQRSEEKKKLLPAQSATNGSSQAKGQRTGFSILSETLTETGRVYRVSKDNKEWSLILPPDVKATPQELESMIEPPASRPLLNLDPKNPPKEWNRQLTFYGIVFDQDTNELAGATIQGVASVAPIKSGSRTATVTGTSDTYGRFKLEVEWGQDISIRVGKTNYISTDPKMFYYSLTGTPRHEPNELTPVAFFLQEKKTADLVTHHLRTHRIKNDGTPVRLDLISGELVDTGGDLIVSIHCPEPYTNLRPIPWKFSIQAVNGGLLEMIGLRLDQMHEAPLNGYQPVISREYGPDSTPYRGQHNGFYYARSRNGQVFSKIRFNTNTAWDERGIAFGFSASVNTNASRTLQTQ